MKLVKIKRPEFQLYHGPVLRAGNTPEDVGKPAVDILRLSERPMMILKGQLTVNHTERFKKLLVKHGVKSGSEICPEEKLFASLQVYTVLPRLVYDPCVQVRCVICGYYL